MGRATLNRKETAWSPPRAVRLRRTGDHRSRGVTVRTMGATADTRIDLNTATAEQLDSIPGVGPVTAQRILDHRRSIGRFTSVDQLLDVSGIGAKTLTKIRPWVRV